MLILKMWKFRKISVLWLFNHEYEVWVLFWWCYCDVIKVSRKWAALLFVFGGQKDVTQMPFSLRCAQCIVTSVLRPAIHVWCKKFALAHDSVADEEGPGRRVVSTTDATIAAVDSDRWRDKIFKRIWTRPIHWKVKRVWRLNTFAYWTYSFFS